MRAVIALAAVLLLTTCSSGSETYAMELNQPMMPPETPFTATGPAVDEGLACAAGTLVSLRMKTVDGTDMTPDAWGALFDEAFDSGGVAEAQSTKEFNCADGTGQLIVEEQIRFDFSEIDPATWGTGRLESGTFECSGTGDLAGMSGSGTVFTDFDADQIVFEGDVQR